MGTLLLQMFQKPLDDVLQVKIENGLKPSPVLPSTIKNLMIDIDGTICEDIPNEEPERMITAKSFPDAMEVCNQWYDEGHIICFFTSRTDAHREYTEKWLKEKGFKYHGIIFNKPRGGNYVWIDNHEVKTLQYTGSFKELVPRMVNI